MRIKNQMFQRYLEGYRGHHNGAVREFYGDLLTRLEEKGICDTCRACPNKCKVPGFDNGVFQCFVRPV